MTIEESIAQTGRRFFTADEAVHAAITPQLDATRGLPKGVGTRTPTLRAISELAKIPRDADDKLVFSIEADMIQPADQLALEPLLSDGSITEITVDEFNDKITSPES